MDNTTQNAPQTITPSSGTSNSADWMAIQMQAPTATPSDIYGMGVNPNNTTLQSEDFYRNSPKVQAMFKDKSGAFDDSAFKGYYLQAQKSLNDFHKQDFSLGSVTTDLWDNTSIARAINAPILRNPVKITAGDDNPFTNLKVAQGSFLGLQEINKWTAPTKSISQVAEVQNVRDGLTGKVLDYKPTDTGIGNIFGFVRDPLVMAQYDDDIKDAKGNVIHRRGELKYDDKGLPYYETLAGRDVAGRQQISAWNTLTTPGSFADKFNFMTDNELDKSITGTVVKSVATLLPLAIGGPVSTAYKAYYIASNLLDATAEIGKSVDAILNDKASSGSFYKWANTLQGYIGNVKTGISEHGKQNMFSLENLANQAVDAVLMMTAQDSVFSWPSKIRTYQMAKELQLAEGGLKDAIAMAPEKVEEYTKKIYDINSYVKKYGMSEDAVIALSKNVSALESYAKYSGYLATGYMAATMATSMSAVAKSAGLNDRDTGMLYLGYMGALAPFFRTGLGRWVEQGLSVDALSADIKEKTLEYAEKYIPKDLAEVSAKIGDNSKKGQGLQLIAAGRKLGQRISDLYSNVSMARKFMNPTYAAIGGAAEMATLEGLKVGVQGIYNSLASAGLTSTKGDAHFDLKGDEILKAIGSAAFGGGFGGAIFHMIGHHETDTFKSADLMGYVINGYGDRVLNTIEKLRQKGQLGSTTLSSDPLTDLNGNKLNDMWSAVNEQHPLSQNDFIGDRMSKTVKVMDLINKANDVLDPQVTADTKDKFYKGIIDTGTDTDLRDRIRKVANDIYETSVDIANMPTSDTTEGGAEIESKKNKLNDLRKELEYLQKDESLDEFFRQGLFNVRDDITHAFGVKDIDDFAKEVNPLVKRFTSLTGDDKDKATKLYNDYKSLEGPGGRKADLIQARQDYDHFNTEMERNGYNSKIDLFKESMKTLKDYVQIQQTSYPREDAVTTLQEITLQDDFLDHLHGVKYIPDFIYDTIKKRLNYFQSEGAGEYLKILSPNVDTLKEGILDNLKSVDLLNEPLINKFLAKKLGGKNLEELLASPELKDLKENGSTSSDYSLLHVLKKLTEFTDNAKDLEVKAARNALRKLTDEQAAEVLFAYDKVLAEGKHPELMHYLEGVKFKDYLKELDQSGSGVDELLGFDDSDTAAIDLLNNMVLVNHMKDVANHDLSIHDNAALIKSPVINDNFVLGLTIDGRYQALGNVLQTNSIQHQDITALQNSVEKAKEFNKQRVSSPLEEMLKPVNEFLETQYQNLETVGYSNYMDRSEEFSDGLKKQIARVDRISALVESAVSINPLVNDFRKENTASLDTDLKNTELTVISSEDASHLFSELQYAKNRLIHLQEVNEYNKNNSLAKLLRDSGLDLTSKIQTLKAIATNEDVVNLLPSLSNLFGLTKVIEYSSSFQTASDSLRNEAISEMATFEHNLYQDFQRLDVKGREKVINSTFKPIDVESSKFYEESDGTKPYNDFMQTIYLAKVYGSSTMDFYEKYAGKYDPETKTFTGLDALKFVPFTTQENAIRFGHLFINGDRGVIAKLFNAYATQPTPEEEYNFNNNTLDTISSHSLLHIWGDPGVGKSSAVAAGIIKLLPEGESDVLLLASRDRQVKGLKAIMDKADMSSRIDSANSKVFRDFLKGLAIKKHDGKSYDFSENDDKVEFYSENGEVQTQFRNLFLNENKGILSTLDIYKDKSDSSYTLNDAITNTLSKYRMIIADEYTHINPIDLGILSKIIDLYNGSTTVQKDASKRILLLALGDVNQMGYIGKDKVRRSFTDVAKGIISQPLTTSLRSGWDLINNTLVDVRNRAVKYNSMSSTDLGKSDTIIASRHSPIKTGYKENIDEGNLGIKVINKQGATSVSDLAFIVSNKSRFTGKDLVYVVKSAEDIPKAQALLKEAIGDNWNMFTDIYTPEEVQGGEYKYAIVDASPNLINEGDAKNYNIKRVHEFLNTMLSRATEATLLLNDGSMNDYVVFDSKPKDKAILQIKLDDETKTKIKSDKQELFKLILSNAVDKEPIEDGQPSVEGKDKMSLPVTRFSEVSTLFDQPTTEPKVFKQEQHDLTSYNYYSTIQDYDSVFGLLPGLKASDRNKSEVEKKISMIINSYKYYLLHKDELGDRQITLKNNFEKLFEDNNYDWENPLFYLEVGKRGEKGMNAGRTELTDTYGAKPTDITVSLKLKLLSTSISDAEHPHDKSLDLTMGFLNSIDDLSKREALKVKLEGQSVPTNLFKVIKGFINDNNEAPTNIGKAILDEGNNRWISEFMNEADFKNLSKIYGSRIIYDDATSMNYDDMKEQYFDFAISEPMVIVANLVEDNNKSILDPFNTNEDYKRYWSDLKGKSVAFISDVYELNALSGREMLDVYIKQLNYFNNEHFAALSNVAKQQYIDEIEDSIVLPSRLEVKYKPGLIKMVKLDNPTSDFLNFRERFLGAVAMKIADPKMDTKKMLERFGTSLYVNDRLVKSLLTVREFLKDAKNRDWFQKEVIAEQNKRADNWLDEVYQDIANKFNNGEPVDRTRFTLSEVSLQAGKAMTLAEFREKLDDLLDPKGDDTIFRGKYPTTAVSSSSKVYKADIDTTITPDDLKLKLSGDKRKDFAGSLIDLKLFNLFKKTRNANFADLIDLSLKALASFENKSDFRKYDLSKVFKDGKIESVILAQNPSESTDRQSNVLATAIKTAGDFSFDLGRLTHPFYNIDFNRLMEHLKVGSSVEPKGTIEEPSTEFSETPKESIEVNESKPKAKKIELTDLASNGEFAHTTVKDILLSKVPELIDLSKHPDLKSDDVTIDPIKATTKIASYTVTLPDGSVYEMEYNMKNDEVKTTPIKIAEDTDPKVVLSTIEKEELGKYDEMINKMLGDKVSDPIVKVALDYFHNAFRYTMLGNNITSMNADFNVVEYDSKLKGYNLTNATNEYIQHITDNEAALRPIAKQLRNVADYIENYTPNIC